MYLHIHHDDGSITSHEINASCFQQNRYKHTIGYIGTKSKEANALEIFRAYFSKSKAILFDETNRGIASMLESLNISAFKENSQQSTIFDNKTFALMYFTSGSTGSPVGALKSLTHLHSEVKVLQTLLHTYHFKRVIVTVPFIHLYGTILGLLYPLFCDIDIVIKEHFLPYDLLEMIDEQSLVITTPLYLKALNKLSLNRDLSTSLFISSTAPLDKNTIHIFKQKFQSDIIQIFGSTETGGIAYKYNDAEIWKPFDGVSIEQNTQGELKVSSKIVSDILYENEFKEIAGEMQIFDYIEKEKEGFRLIGRSSKIFKIAGKRYSTIQIENILEDEKNIRKALIFVELDKQALRGEYLDITLESDYTFTAKEIKKILQKQLSNLKFTMKIKIVNHIPSNQVGKKLKIGR
ncbi:MAG: AMP-binding protein [Sulfurovum sp.]